jgi:type II secretory ATPase GspE/PulE/Tfp pilus assembly ATPase PilB-like protein
MSTSPLENKSNFHSGLTHVLDKINSNKSFINTFPEIEGDILTLFNAERITIYQRTINQHDIYSLYKTGNELNEIRVPMNTQSLSGYVSVSQESIIVNDVYDAQELASIHPSLKFNPRFDHLSHYRTKSMLVVPIKNEDVLLGVLQLINCTNEGHFDNQQLENAKLFAKFLGQKFRWDIGGYQSPFDYLIHKDIINQPQLERWQLEDKSTNEIIRAIRVNYHVSSDQLGMSLALFYQVPFIKYAPDKYHLHPKAENINISYLKKNHMVLLEDNAGKALLLMNTPNDASKLMEIENIIQHCPYEINVGFKEDIFSYLGSTPDSNDGVLDNLTSILKEFDDNEENEDSEEGLLAEDAPAVVKLVNRLLLDAKRLNASDIHIEPSKFHSPARVRMRIDGVCQEILKIPSNHVAATVARIKIISQLNIAERRLPQDGKFASNVQGILTEVRVATLPTVFGEGVVMRILASEGAMPLESLNLSPLNQLFIGKTILHPHGIILVVGPTGSGKTTTLHAVLGKLNTPDKKIWTVEDPVEITQVGLQQVQVNNKIGFKFSDALRAFLRADPDIILVGEIRDRETAHAGVEASLTGHLVLSTLHTNSAPETITRLLDLDVDPVNFAEACLGILAQRLIRTLCSNCKEFYLPEETEINVLKKNYGIEISNELALDATTKLYKAKGCEKCNHSGYKGRTGLHEMLIPSKNIKAIIYRKGSIEEIKNQAIKEGMRTLLQDGIYKLTLGQIDLAQLRLVTTLS